MMQRRLATNVKKVNSAVAKATVVNIANDTAPCYNCGQMFKRSTLQNYGGTCGRCYKKVSSEKSSIIVTTTTVSTMKIDKNPTVKSHSGSNKSSNSGSNKSAPKK